MLEKKKDLKKVYATFFNVVDKGFTIAEILVVLAILAILVIVAMPVLTQKQARAAKISPHGQFECYVKPDGNVYQRRTIEVNQGAEVLKGPVGTATGVCTFTPPSKRVAYYMAAFVGGGGSGSNYNHSGYIDQPGNPGTLRTYFFPTFSGDVTMKPGAGGLLPTSGVSIYGNAGTATTFSSGTMSAPFGAGGTAILGTVSASPVDNVITDSCPAGEVVWSGFDYYSGEPIAYCSTYGGSGSSISWSYDYEQFTDPRGIVHYPQPELDYWVGALYSCSNKSPVNGHSWSIPSGSWAQNQKGFGSALNGGVWGTFWVTGDGDDMNNGWVYTGDGTGVGSVSESYRTGASTNYYCVRPLTLANNYKCVKNTLTPDDSDYLCYEGFVRVASYTVSSSAAYTALKTKYSDIFKNYFNNLVSNYNLDFWGGALEACYNRDAAHNWRLPSASEYGLLNTLGAINSAQHYFWAGPDTSATEATAYDRSDGTVFSHGRNDNLYWRSLCVMGYTPQSEASTSGFDSYVSSGGYHFSVPNSGDGGAAKKAGYPGAVLIVW